MSAFQYDMKRSCEIYAHRSEQKAHAHTHTQIYTRIILTVLKLRLSSCLIKHRAINACDGVYAPRIPNRGSRF